MIIADVHRRAVRVQLDALLEAHYPPSPVRACRAKDVL